MRERAAAGRRWWLCKWSLYTEGCCWKTTTHLALLGLGRGWGGVGWGCSKKGRVQSGEKLVVNMLMWPVRERASFSMNTGSYTSQGDELWQLGEGPGVLKTSNHAQGNGQLTGPKCPWPPVSWRSWDVFWRGFGLTSGFFHWKGSL